MAENSDIDTEIRHIGVSGDSLKQRLTGRIKNYIASKKERTLAESPDARLSEQSFTLLRTCEAKAKDFLSQKLLRLGGDPKGIQSFTSIQYVEDNSDRHGENRGYSYGSLDLKSNLIQCNVNPESHDLLKVASTVTHELSHAAGRKEFRVYWKRDLDNKLVIANAKSVVGLGRVGNSEVLVKGIDNGLALMDQVDMYYAFLRDYFPERSKIRYEYVPASEKFVNELDKTQFGPIDRSKLEAFIVASIKPHSLRRDRPAYVQIETGQLENYRFIEEICRTLGYVTAHSKGENGLSNTELIALGRDLLDKDRLVTSEENTGNEGLRALVQIFGGDKAKVLFSVNDHGTNLKQAMVIVKSVQSNLGI